jgi:hypothetical protein
MIAFAKWLLPPGDLIVFGVAYLCIFELSFEYLLKVLLYIKYI